MMNLTRVVALAIFSGVLAIPQIGAAAPILNNTGLATPDTTITFSEHVLAPAASVTNQYADLGVTFSPTLYYNTQPIFFPTASLANYGSGSPSDPASIFFLAPVTAAAVAVQTNPGTTSFIALLNGIQVESFTASTALSVVPDLTHASDYFGFSGILFNELRIDNLSGSFQIDNLEFDSAVTPVPEPTSLLLLGSGIAGIAAKVRKRRKPQVQ